MNERTSCITINCGCCKEENSSLPQYHLLTGNSGELGEEVAFSYPAGFSQENTLVISTAIYTNELAYTMPYVQSDGVYTRTFMSSAGIIFINRHTSFVNKQVKILICRMLENKNSAEETV